MNSAQTGAAAVKFAVADALEDFAADRYSAAAPDTAAADAIAQTAVAAPAVDLTVPSDSDTASAFAAEW